MKTEPMKFTQVEEFTDRIEAVVQELARDPVFHEGEHTFHISVNITTKRYGIYTKLTTLNSLGGITFLGEGRRDREEGK